jgi:hypothetical protein
MKSVYVVQPYQVGSKKAKSLAVVIPAAVVKKCHINSSTIFALRPGDENEILMHPMKTPLLKSFRRTKMGYEEYA